MARLYVPLDVEFATNDRILAAGPLASYLYVCSLAHAKRQGDRDRREGFVNAGALRVLTIGFPGKPEKYAQALVRSTAAGRSPHGSSTTRAPSRSVPISRH